MKCKLIKQSDQKTELDHFKKNQIQLYGVYRRHAFKYIHKQSESERMEKDTLCLYNSNHMKAKVATIISNKI